MPSPTKFLGAFGILKLVRDANWNGKVTRMSHTAVVPYRKYDYIFELALSPKSSKSLSSGALVSSLRSHVRNTHKVVTTHYGNPYECVITSVQGHSYPSNGTIQLTITGKATRQFPATSPPNQRQKPATRQRTQSSRGNVRNDVKRPLDYDERLLDRKQRNTVLTAPTGRRLH